jgi:hypothetical protein
MCVDMHFSVKIRFALVTGNIALVLHIVFYYYDTAGCIKTFARENFDPRATPDQILVPDAIKRSIQTLTTVVPDTCLRQLWGVHPEPPNFEMEVEIASQADLYEQTLQLILAPGQTSEYIFSHTPSNDLVYFIEESTRAQHACKLWQDLRIGRLTSSNFGQIYHTKGSSNSLLATIIHRRYETSYQIA